MTLNLDFVRGQFPALDGDWTFFDNAGGSQTLGSVISRIREYLTTSDVQLGASYAVSELAGQRVDESRRAMATYINCAADSEVVMGPSTSMNIRVLSICLGETLAPGDEIIVTNCDHEANIGAWRDLEKKGMTIKTWRINTDSWALDLEDLAKLITDKTRLVALTHASNILGGINPIKDIARFVHDRGAMICVDAVAYAPHRRIDVQDLDVDFYALSFYKTYGPHYAMLYGKQEHLLRMPGINHFFIGPEEIPYKFQPGSVNYELCYGIMGLWDYLGEFAAAHDRSDLANKRSGQVEFAFDIISRHEEALSTRLLDFLKTKSNVRLIGQDDPDRRHRVPTVSFVVEGRDSAEIVLDVDKHNIGIRYGDFYARRLIDDLGLTPRNGVVRVSMVHYNTLQELDRLIELFDGLF